MYQVDTDTKFNTELTASLSINCNDTRSKESLRRDLRLTVQPDILERFYAQFDVKQLVFRKPVHY